MTRFILVLLFMPMISFSQGMKISWEDRSGREFSINTKTLRFSYSMVGGDNIYYNGRYDGGPEGSVKQVGSVKIYYNGRYDSGPEGSVKQVGGMKIYYNGRYDSGPEGSIKKTTGSVLY